MEEWRPIPSTEGRYEASSEGRIRSLWFRNNKADLRRAVALILTPTAPRHGYQRVYVAGRRHSVHRLVLEAFTGPCPPGMEAAHLNGNQQDNRPVNLVWCTRKENHRHMVGHGTRRFGPLNNATKFSKELIDQVRALLALGRPAYAIARETGVSYRYVQDLRDGRRVREVA